MNQNINQKTRVVVEFDALRSTITLTIFYNLDDWKKLESLYVERGLERYRSSRVFGSLEKEIYRYVDNGPNVFDLSDVERDGYRIRFLDDINSELMYMSGSTIEINLAMFRIIPDCENNICTTKVTYRIGIAPPMKLLTLAIIEATKQLAKVLKKKKVKYRLEVTTE